MGAVNIDSYFIDSISDKLFIFQWLLETVVVATGIWLIIKYHTKKEKTELGNDKQEPYWLFNVIDEGGHKVMIEKAHLLEAKKEVYKMHPSCIISSCRFYKE